MQHSSQSQRQETKTQPPETPQYRDAREIDEVLSAGQKIVLFVDGWYQTGDVSERLRLLEILIGRNASFDEWTERTNNGEKVTISGKTFYQYFNETDGVEALLGALNQFKNDESIFDPYLGKNLPYLFEMLGVEDALRYQPYINKLAAVEQRSETSSANVVELVRAR